MAQRYIKLTWRQRGHSVTDPCGHEEHFMNCVWKHLSECTDAQEANRQLQKAGDYCRRQQGWLWWEATLHDGEQCVFARIGC